MLGSAVFRILSEKDDWKVFGTVRSEALKGFFSSELGERLVVGCDIENHDALAKVFSQVGPDVVINCIALSKGSANVSDHPMQSFSIYALLPHRLAVLCSLAKARLVHISTDGVFSGTKGGYTEDDPPDAKDMYGISKSLGEVRYPHTITLRTSIIGLELQTAHGLIGWFLSQRNECKCFTRAIFSGLPTIVLAQIIRDIVIPRADLFGIYHVAAEPISKFDLLRLVADVYGKSIDLEPDDQVVIDRSLNAQRFRAATGYVTPAWPELITLMHSYR
jgi:dTDP-4-dehydrorhamnose reductase